MRFAFVGLALATLSVSIVGCAVEPGDDAAETESAIIDRNTQRNGMHACKVDALVTGARFRTNEFACDDTLIHYRRQDEKVEGLSVGDAWDSLRGNWDGWLTCPEKSAVTGIHKDDRKLTCVRAGTIEVDRVSVRNPDGIDTCTKGSFVTGINVFTNAIRCARRVQKCFGFEGDECSATPGANSAAGAQHISGGSLEHDTCCFMNPSGDGCINGPFADGDDVCKPSWDKANDRYWGGIKWQRQRDPGKRTLVGHSYPRRDSLTNRELGVTTPFEDVCAVGGSIVVSADVAYCCTKRGERLLPRDLTTAKYLRAPNIGIVDKGKVESRVRGAGDVSVCVTPLPIADE